MTMIENRMKATGRSMKSQGVFTLAIAARSLTSMIPPRTMPRMIGTMGRDRRLRMNPKSPKPAANMQSLAELRKE